MKTALIAIACLLVGLGAGLFYDCSAGFVDGQTHSIIGMIPVAHRYGAYRSTNEIEKREKLMDAVTIASAVTMSQGKSYLSVSMFFHPKAGSGLMDSLIMWQLDHPDTAYFRAADVPNKARVAEVYQRMKSYWEREVQGQKTKRSEIQQKQANRAVESTC